MAMIDLFCGRVVVQPLIIAAVTWDEALVPVTPPCYSFPTPAFQEDVTMGRELLDRQNRSYCVAEHMCLEAQICVVILISASSSICIDLVLEAMLPLILIPASQHDKRMCAGCGVGIGLRQ